MEHEKKVALLRKLEMRRADYVKTEKTKKEVEKLESQMMVASQAMDSTSAEIVKIREIELYPQLIELVKGLVFSFFLLHFRVHFNFLYITLLHKWDGIGKAIQQ